MSQSQSDAGNCKHLLESNRSLLAEVQALSSRIAAVNEIANAINRSLNVDEILRVVGKQAKWLLDFQHCSVCLQEQEFCCRIVTLFGSAPECNCCPILENNPIGRAIKRRQAQLNPDDYATSFLSSYTSQIIIPLESENRVIGSLIFAKKKPSAYSIEDLRIGYLLAIQLSAAIQNARRFEEINQLCDRLKAEQKHSEQLLLNILPAKIAHELKQTGKVKPIHYKAASVLFTDFKDFTQLAEQLTPEELVNELDYCFSCFDMIAEAHNMEKLKTIGDSYMGVAGIPTPSSTHAIDAVLVALQIQMFMGWRKLEKLHHHQPYWQTRVGIHSGPLMAGIIGQKKFTYDVWGDTVNTASRMESCGVANAVNISHTTFELVKDFFDCEYRGKISAKNKGDIDMYLVQGIKKHLSVGELELFPNDSFKALYAKISQHSHS